MTFAGYLETFKGIENISTAQEQLKIRIFSLVDLLTI